MRISGRRRRWPGRGSPPSRLRWRWGGSAAIISRPASARPGSLRLSGGLAAVGLAAALLIGRPGAAIVGAGLVGLGLANSVPVLFGAAGRTPGLPAGAALAAVATTGYGGFLAGPPAIGIVAETIGLPAALGLVALACALIGMGAGLVRATARAGRTGACPRGLMRPHEADLAPRERHRPSGASAYDEGRAMAPDDALPRAARSSRVLRSCFSARPGRRSRAAARRAPARAAHLAGRGAGLRPRHPGGSRPSTLLADLRGRVVLLYFWATW